MLKEEALWYLWNEKKEAPGHWAGSVAEHATLDPGVRSSSPRLEVKKEERTRGQKREREKRRKKREKKRSHQQTRNQS